MSIGTQALVAADYSENRTGALITMALQTVGVGSRDVYGAAIRSYLDWVVDNQHPGIYASMLAYRTHLAETRRLAPATINRHLSALRLFFRTAANVGACSEADYRAVKEVRNISQQGGKYGVWLDKDALLSLVLTPDTSTQRGLRDRAILAVFIGCGLRRSEVSNLTWGHLYREGDVWLIRDLLGKHNRTRTVPVPAWVMNTLEEYAPDVPFRAQTMQDVRIFTRLFRNNTRGESITPYALWGIVRSYARRSGIEKLSPHDLRRSYAKLMRVGGAELEEVQALLGHSSVQTTERYIDTAVDYGKMASMVVFDLSRPEGMDEIAQAVGIPGGG